MSALAVAQPVTGAHHVVTARRLRRLVLEQSKRAGVGHIGSALSVVDILSVLYDSFIDPADMSDARATLVLSKGHAALALYCALHLRGLIRADQLDTYCADDSPLGVHPEHTIPGVDVSTGSLGHGLSIAAGRALAAKLRSQPRSTFALLSDAELNEGSIWEAIMFAAHHHLDHLVAIIDLNGQQALGPTRAVLDLGAAEDVAYKVTAFGWAVEVVDGHDSAALTTAIGAQSAGKPRMIVARTVAGHGVSFMERQVSWHYLPMNDAQYEQAMREVDR
jgi:transketolase